MKTVKITNTNSPFFGKEGLATRTADGTCLCVYLDGHKEFNVFYSSEVEVVGSATVLAATRLAYNQISAKEFPVRSLVNRVRSITERPELMDGTILRRLRELRDEGIDYEVIDNHKAIYRKL
jgi:hypothetical protein